MTEMTTDHGMTLGRHARESMYKKEAPARDRLTHDNFRFTIHFDGTRFVFSGRKYRPGEER